MVFRILISPLCLGLLSCGALAPDALSAANEELEPGASASQIDAGRLKALVETAPIIVIAELQDVQSLPQKTETTQPSEVKIDIQKELDRAREETARTFTGLNVGPLVRLLTVETLKGPDTKILSIPAADSDFKEAAPGDLFLVMMNSNHPDAIRAISSAEDPWVERVKAALSN